MTWTVRGSAATCSLKAAIGGEPSTTRPPASVVSATLRPTDPHEELEQPPRHRAGEHLARAELAGRLIGELHEQRLVRRGEPLDVLLDSLVDDVHQPGTTFQPSSLRVTNTSLG